MAEKPVIMVVDDEPAALAAMHGALVRRYGADYRIVSNPSASSALDALAQIKAAGEEVALVIADQWMPETTGSEFPRARSRDRAYGEARAASRLGRPCSLAHDPTGLRIGAAGQLSVQTVGPR